MSHREVERLVRKEPIEDLYDIGQELGRGKFAIVKRCTEKSTGTHYAAKYLRKRRGGKSCREDIMVEIDIMRQAMNHQRIVKLHEVFESQREMIIIIELATGGELFRMIAVDPLPEQKARDIVWELLDGVQHLHSMSIVHLDLKPENILLYRKGQLDIKIADFGLAMQISPGEQIRTLVGTAEYVAPEILNFEPINISADMWSIGALTYALLTGYSPFQGETHNHTFYNVSMCEYDFEDEVFDVISQEAKDFIEDLLQKKPSDRPSAAQCLQHPWMQSVNHSPVPNHPPQVHEGLNSSTSSLDSALWLESSSLEPSPSSSASSSFAPRPNDKSEEEPSNIKQHQQEDMKQFVSKLCTEMQKAEIDCGVNEMIGSTHLDGSASSIGSNESCNTLKPEEEDVGVFIPQSNTPPPSGYQNRTQSSSSLMADEDPRSLSRPSSGLRVTTPIQGDVAALAPETIEKLKKLEKLKQRKREEKESLEAAAAAAKTKTKNSTDRRFSSPVTSAFSKLKVSAFKSKSQSAVKEEDLEADEVRNIAEERLNNTSQHVNSQTSPFSVDKRRHHSSAPSMDQPSPVSTDKYPSHGSSRNRESPVPKRSQPSPVPTHNQESPVATHKWPNPDHSKQQKSPSAEDKKRSPDPVHDRQSPVPIRSQPSPIPKNTQERSKSPALKVSPEPRGSETARPVSPKPSLSVTSSNLPTHEKPRSNSPLRSGDTQTENTPISSGSSTSSPTSLVHSPSPVTQRGKSYSPHPQAVSNQKTHVRSTKSSSPSAANATKPTTSSVVLRNKMKNQMRISWRQTPHIDADAIEAILKGDFDSDVLGTLEACVEENEQPRTKSPITEGGKEECDNLPKKTHVSKVEDGLLKRSGHSDSEVVKRDVTKRVAIIPSSERRSKHKSLFFGSPLHSPSYKTSPGNIPIKNDRVSGLQKSMSLSYSSPDLVALLNSSGSKSRKKPKREDTYVTGSSTPKESNRRSFFGGGGLTRSLTISGKGNKKSNAEIREKYKSKNMG